MPGKIKVKVLAGRNLPVMDRASDTTDAFVEIKFGGVTHKTDVCRKSLNPHWSSTEWYRFEVDESELQDEPLQLRLMDHDTYSANDAIGKVVISLAPLLSREANNVIGTAGPPGGAVMSGWIPVFDTMHGIRGELNVIVKVELFSDFNKYKTSSCGVQFFHCQSIPPGYRATSIHGFVEELVVNDDPEYQWIDKIRTPRASNEARQVAFIKLSNQVQRLIGLKAAELGANAVVGYQQDFDLEGEAGVVARAIGTAVSITLLPTPSQPMNVPPCTQQQLKKCLDILATDDESVTDLSQYYQTHQEELKKVLHILSPKDSSMLDETEAVDDDDDRMEQSRPSIHSYTGAMSLFQDDYAHHKSLRHISEDQTDLNRLLNRRDSDEDSDSSGPIQKIKKIKTNFFTKRFSKRKRDKREKQDDQISIQSNTSDTSRISLAEIKNEFKKRLKKPKVRKVFTNPDDEGVGMASILARSVIHAHTSLACIAETQDSEHSTQDSTMRRTSESEPTIMSDEDRPRKISLAKAAEIKDDLERKSIPEIHFASLKNVSSEEAVPERVRKTSESCPTSPVVARADLLKLPGDKGYFDSVSSALSGESSEAFSSSEEDDESFDGKSDLEETVETTESVVNSVLNHEVNPAFIAQMDRKLSILENVHPSMKEIVHADALAEKDEDTFNPLIKATEVDDNTEVSENKNIEIKTTDEKIEKLESSTSATDSDNEKLEKHKNSGTSDIGIKEMRQVQSTTGSTTPRVVAMTPKRLSDDFTLPQHRQDRNRTISESKGLVHTAMETMLIDKAQALLPETPEPSQMKAPSCDDHSKTKRDHKDFLSTIKSTVKDKVHVSLDSVFGKHKDMKSGGLVHTAMETILMDKAESMIPDTPEPNPVRTELVFVNVEKPQKVYQKHTKPIKSTGLLHSALETMLIDKIQAVLPDSSQPIPVHFESEIDAKSKKALDAPTKESSGIIHSAIETMLIDRVQAVLPDTNEPIPIHIESNAETEKSTEESTGLVHSAIETMLIDRIQAAFPDASEPIPIHMDKEFDTKSTKSHETTKESSGLIHSAVETMLIDKVQTVLPGTNEPISIHIGNNDETEILFKTKADESTGLTHSAMETMLIDKVQIVLPDTNEPIPINFQEQDGTKSNINEKILPKQEEVSKGLVQTEMETILIDKIRTVYPKSTDPDLVNDCIDTKEKAIEDKTKTISKLEVCEDLKSPTLVGTAMQAILMDNMQSVVAITNINSRPSISSEDTKSFSDTEDLEEVDTKKKLVRQDSIHSFTESKEIGTTPVLPESKMSSDNITRPPVLQHFHPLLSELETIPSEGSFEIETSTNNASVCGNSHAACCFDRNDRDRDRCERDRDRCDKDKGSPKHARHESYGGREPVAPAHASLNSSSIPMGIHRRSSDSDLSVTPKGGSLNTSSNMVGSGGGAILRPSMNTDNLDMLEYPFLTMSEYPPGFVVHIGGCVCARSVKLVDGGGESAARAAWWAELRTELRAHARALRCNAVLAYTDCCSICEDVCILSASGTAAVINLDCDFNAENDVPLTVSSNMKSTLEEEDVCSMAHVPYSPGTGPYRAELSTCGGCRRARVPTVLLATCAKPNRLMSYTKAVTLTAVAGRARRAAAACEPGARDISDQLPFLEYELHKLLLAKLRMQGANAVFSLQTQIALGERCVMALATGAAVRLWALPPPAAPTVKATDNDKEALDIQRKLWDTFTANKQANGYDIGVTEEYNGMLPESAGEERPTLDLCADKDACVLELDEAEDVETARTLTCRRSHVQAYTPALHAHKHAQPQAFAQVSRARVGGAGCAGGAGGAGRAGDRHVRRALDSAAYKLRRLQPAALVAAFHLDLPDDEMQLVVSGTAIPLADPSKLDLSDNGLNNSHGGSHNGKGDAADDIFALDEEQLVKGLQDAVLEDKNPLAGHVPSTVSVTALPYISSARISRRVCALRLLFVRETTAVRELGGLSGFLHTFTCEVLAIARAYTAALGGNALTSFYIKQLMLQDNAHKNQGQCLLSIGGDIIHITY